MEQMLECLLVKIRREPFMPRYRTTNRRRTQSRQKASQEMLKPIMSSCLEAKKAYLEKMEASQEKFEANQETGAL
jgi:hypothetical protein